MKHYPEGDLELKNDSEEEQIRTRAIFNDLKLNAEKGIELFEREKDFLCTCLKLTVYEKDGKPEDFKHCSNFIFKELYLTYFHNNLAGPFFKAKRGKIVEVSEREKNKDWKFLQKIADIWLKEIEKLRHTDLILQELSVETRKDLKELDKEYTRLRRKFRRQQNDYKLKKDKILLQSKFIYLLTKSVKENSNEIDFEIPFGGEILEFTTYSLIHITSRHYAESIKDKKDKTFHYKNFHPNELHTDLKKILIKIDGLKLIDLSKTKNIIFDYEEVIYQRWIEKKTKQIVGLEMYNSTEYNLFTQFMIYQLLKI